MAGVMHIVRPWIYTQLHIPLGTSMDGPYLLPIENALGDRFVQERTDDGAPRRWPYQPEYLIRRVAEPAPLLIEFSS